MRVLLGVTGSVAAKLDTKLANALRDAGHDVMYVYTKSAKNFSTLLFSSAYRGWSDDKESSEILSECIRKDWWTDDDEFPIKYDNVKEDGTLHVPHIFLKDWAEAFVIAPLTANTLAKISNGLADNLLTCVFRAWNMDKPIVLAPAMNADMWNHPVTQKNLWELQTTYYATYSGWYGKTGGIRYTDSSLIEDKRRKLKSRMYIVLPVEKKLACGQFGVGALAPVNDIVDLVNKL